MAVKAVVFDIGGVIVDVDLEGYAAVAAPLFCASVEDMRAAVLSRIVKLETGQLNSDGFWKEVGELLWRQGKGKQSEPEQCNGLWARIIREKMKTNLDMLNLCWSLQRKGIVVAALSNTIPEHAEHLAAIGTYKAFNPCILSCQVGLRKPDPAIYFLTAEQIGKPVKECLFIDDSPVNVEAARAVGMQAHHYTTFPSLLQLLGRQRLL